MAFQPAAGIIVDDGDARVLSAPWFSLTSGSERENRPVMAGSRSTSVTCSTFGCENLAHRQPVAAAQHQYVAGPGQGQQAGMHQGLVVAVLVARGELQVAVDVQAQVVVPARDHQALVGRGLGMDHVVAVQALFRPGRHVAGIDEAQRQQAQHHAAAHRALGGLAHFGAEQPGGPQRHAGVQHAEQETGAQQPQLGRQQQRKDQRHGQRAQVVEGQHPADDLAELGLALIEHAHYQRDLHAHHQADDEHAHVERGAERRRQPGEHQEQHGGRYPAQQRDQQLHVDEAIQNVFIFYIF